MRIKYCLLLRDVKVQILYATGRVVVVVEREVGRRGSESGGKGEKKREKRRVRRRERREERVMQMKRYRERGIYIYFFQDSRFEGQ